MTTGQTLRLEGFQFHLESDGRTVTTKSNNSFRALVSDADTQDTQFLMGEDLREYARIEAVRDEVPSELSDFDADSGVDVVMDDGEELTIVKRVDNPADVFIRFYAQKLTAGDKAEFIEVTQ
jgi:hypothetical protein